MEVVGLIAFLAGILLISGVSGRIKNTIITLPILYVLFGLCIGLIFRDQIALGVRDPLVQIIAQLTLMLVLATDSSRIKVHSVITNHTLPLRLLGICLPLTILLGTVLAAVIFGQLEFWEAAILAIILAPTDASLGESVVSNRRVPVRIRQALNVESGLNDGIAMPFLILAVSLAVSTETQVGTGYYIGIAASQVIFGVLAGAMIGYLGARYLIWGRTSGWMSVIFEKINWLAMVLLTFWIAELIGGNGYIAAFVFGMTSGNVIGAKGMKSLDDFAETENSLLMLATYMIFGMVVLLPALERINLPVVIYAVLSLTIVRMIPVAVGLIGTKLQKVSVLFIGWFGPRGIASILYVLTVLETDKVAGVGTIYTVAMITVFMSVLAHGISAAPIADWYGGYISKLDKKGIATAETTMVPEIPTRGESLSAQSYSSSQQNIKTNPGGAGHA